jgi:hypothetical protein
VRGRRRTSDAESGLFLNRSVDGLAVERETALVQIVFDVELLLAGNVHGVERHEGARQTRKNHIDIDLKLK